MALIRKVRGFTPEIGENCFLAETACLIGQVVLGNDCSVWYNAVVRGDVHYIKLGNRVNVQDGAVIHCTYEKSPTIVGNNVSIGHNAIIHGCTIEDNVLIGMGSIVMDDAYIESGAIIAAGAVVSKNTRVERNCIYAGIPAKKIREVSSDLKADEIERIAKNYLLYSSWFKED